MPSLTSISISQPALIMGQSAQLVATATYSDGTTADVSSTATWSVVSESPAYSATGIHLLQVSSSGALTVSEASALLNGGTATIQAQVGNVTATVLLTVQALAITALSFVSNSLTFSFADILPQIQVQATFNDGSTSVINRQSIFPLTWQSSDTSIISFVDNRGTLHIGRSGSANVQVSAGGITISHAVVVTPALSGLRYTGTLRKPVGQTSQLHVFADYDDGTSVEVTALASWVSVFPGVATVSATGLVTAVAPGAGQIQATFQNVTLQAAFFVPTLVRTVITGPNTAVAGDLLTYSLLEIYNDGTSIDVTNSATWLVSQSSIASVLSPGQIQALTAGPTAVLAYTPGSSPISTNLSVQAAGLVSIELSATSPVVAVGSTLQLTATGVYANGARFDITGSVSSWKSSNASISIDAHGLATGMAPGLAILAATVQGLQATLRINVVAAADPTLKPQFYSHLTQEMLNYFPATDIRVREAKYTLDAQLLNVAAQELEMSRFRMARELRSMRLSDCPANIDNRGVFYQQNLDTNFDFDADHFVMATVDGVTKAFGLLDSTIPVPARVTVDTEVSIIPMTDSQVFQVTGQGIVVPYSLSTLRVATPAMPSPGRLVLWTDGSGTSTMNVTVRITGYRYPKPAWASKQSKSSETLRILNIGTSRSKFAWAEITEIQVSGLPIGTTLTGYSDSAQLTKQLDPERPYVWSGARDSRFNRYWSFADGLLKEEYLSSNYEGFRYIQSYAAAPVTGIAIEPNTYGMFVAQGTQLQYIDRREPMPANLSATALTVEPLFGLDVSIDETQLGQVRYALLRPVAYGGSDNATQYRYLLQFPSGSTYALTPDGVLASYSSTAGWRRGNPIPLTLPLAELGTYVITLQCASSDGTITSDPVPVPNFALAPLATFDLSGIVPSIQGLSFDDRGRLWAWTGTSMVPLKLHYDAYLLDEDTQSIYLTEPITGLSIDGVTI